MSNWKPSLIPRKTFNGFRVTQVRGDRNRLVESKVPLVIENAGKYPMNSSQLWTLPEGIRTKSCYRLITTTELFPQLQEGAGDDIRDVVEIDGLHFFVYRVNRYDQGVQSNFDCIVVYHDPVHGPTFKEA